MSRKASGSRRSCKPPFLRPPERFRSLDLLHRRIRRCRRCFPHGRNPESGLTAGKPVPGGGAARRGGLVLIGQAPGIREPAAQRMFAWTAGRRLFSWLASIGLPEGKVRSRAYLTAVTKCYPGRSGDGPSRASGRKGKGDRRPAPWEVAQCAPYLDEALRLLKPRLLVTIGGLAAERILGVQRLSDAIGRRFTVELPSDRAAVIPLPHPSGASTWLVMPKNKRKLAKALALIRRGMRSAGF